MTGECNIPPLISALRVAFRESLSDTRVVIKSVCLQCNFGRVNSSAKARLVLLQGEFGVLGGIGDIFVSAWFP